MDFEDIVTASFVYGGGETNVKAELRLKTGETVTLRIDHPLSCFGSSSIADIKISLSDIRKIDIHGPADDTP